VVDLVAEELADLLAQLVDEPAWMADALCREPPYRELRWWFGGHGGDQRPARAVCARCTVRAECLDYALTTRVCGELIDGVWGGTSKNERRIIIRRRAA
jgi:WhiB family redox-sensing transcriptional regulator